MSLLEITQADCRRTTGKGAGQSVRYSARLLFPCLYALLAWVLFARLSLFDGSRLPGGTGGDLTNELWFLEFARQNLTSGHLLGWSDLMGYPAGFNTAASASFPLLGVLAAPVTAVAGPVAAYNVLLRLGLFLSALACWLVLRRVLASSFAAGIGGLIYGFSPYMVHAARLHMFLAWVPLPPIILYLLYRQLCEGRGTPWKTGVTVGALLAAQYLIDAAIAASTVLLALIVGLLIVVISRPGRRPPRSRLRDTGVVTSAAGAVAAVVLGYPIWQFLLGHQHVGLTQPLRATGFPAITTIAAPSGSASLAGRLGLFGVSYLGLSGSIGYLGPALIVALIWIAARNRVSRLVQAAGLLLVVAWILALGPYLTMTSRVTHTPLPMWLLVHLPLLRDLVASRLTLYLWLGVAVLVAVAIDRLVVELPYPARRRAARISLATLALALVGLALAAPASRIGSFATDPLRGFTSSQIQSRIPDDGVVLTYPYTTIADNQPLLWQIAVHLRFKLIGGYANFPGSPSASLEAHLLKPRTIECFFNQAQFPQADWSDDLAGGCPLAPIKLTTAELRKFVRRYQVRSIVAERVGYHPERVIALVTAAYGRPAQSWPFLAWRT